MDGIGTGADGGSDDALNVEVCRRPDTGQDRDLVAPPNVECTDVVFRPYPDRRDAE